MDENNRRAAIIQYLQNSMEEYFNNSCRQFQTDVETHGSEIWNELRCAIDEVLKSVLKVQDKNQKGAIQYIAFSFLRSCLYQNNLEFNIEALDDSFYLDNKETAGGYQPTFLQERYSDDLSLLYKEASRKFVRIQGHELFWIKEQYTHYYEAVVYRMIENLSGMIMRKVSESGIHMTDDFKIIYGEFMDKSVVLYTKEKKEDEVFSD